MHAGRPCEVFRTQWPPAPPESPPGKPELVDTIKKLMTREQVALGGPIVNTIDMVLVPIPPGEFLMGSPESEEGRHSRETQHLVKITKTILFECLRGDAGSV